MFPKEAVDHIARSLKKKVSEKLAELENRGHNVTSVRRTSQYYKHPRQSNDQLSSELVIGAKVDQILKTLRCNVVAVTRRHARLIQINDHMQLPATWDPIENKAKSNDRRQFARLLRLNGLTEYSMLEVQNQPVPTIAAYPSKAFYGDALCNAVLASGQPRNFPRASQPASMVFI